jgi:tetratricopeptide (TPR) repeat protein/SAM-dependent methyltransferase
MSKSERRTDSKSTKASDLPPKATSEELKKTALSDELKGILAAGKQYHANGNLPQAAQAYQKVLAAVPNQPTALYLLGIACLQTGQTDNAIQLLKSSLAVQPTNPEAHNNLGVALNSAGNAKDAESCYRQAISLKPDYVGALKNLGALLASNNKLDAGLDYYQKAVSLMPNFAEGHKAIGDILSKQQRYEEALESYFKARALTPMDADVLTSAGNALQYLTRYREALKLHSQAVNMAPDEDRHWVAFSDCVSSMSFSSTDEGLENLLLKLLEKSELSPASLMFPIISALRHREEFADLLDNPNSILEDDKTLSAKTTALTQSKLFLRLMTKVPVADLRIERLLTILRTTLLSKCAKGDLKTDYETITSALAQQCFINEYAYATNDQELEELGDFKKAIAQKFANKEHVKPLEWLIVGCYEPLKDVTWRSDISLKKCSPEAKNAYHLQVTAPDREREISKTIPQLTDIADETSQNVRAQYEENPYPRWIHTSRLTPQPIKDVLCAPPLSFELDNYSAPKSLDTLVAGCGTGQHAIQAASRFDNTTLTAVDLSLSSLSYAKRKTEEMGIKNIKYIQGDILELDKIGKQFDVIECGGVLHHMKEPLKGWEVLVRLLRDDGLMKIGLYSEKGRPDIIAGREFIEQGGYGSSATEMRRCRQDIIAAAENGDQKLIQLCMRGDFYSLSPCRDLIFHVQEHRFTIPEISEALDTLGLEFIGFETPTPQTLTQFRKENPSCPKNEVLNRWHDFEDRFPDTFRGMYQFWCRKSAR